MLTENNRPPRLALAFLRWFCHPHFIEDIEGDLLERFHHRKEKLGVRKAKWLFIIDVLLLFRPGLMRDLQIRIPFKSVIMKKSDWIKLSAISLLLIVVIALPFLPGPPNKVVIFLSAVAQSAGFVGLLVVPVGVIWAVVEMKEKRKKNGDQNWKPSYHLAITATAIIAVICLFLVIGISINAGLFTGLFTLVLVVLQLKWAIREIRKRRNSKDIKLNPAPFYLLLIPLTAFVARTCLMQPLSNYSRSMAIERSQVLIAAIENYKAREGQYPESIQDLQGNYLKEIPRPSVMGIQDFRYNKINEHYSLSFSQWLEIGSLEEIVLYDKSNLKNNLTGPYAKYDYGFDLCRVKGAFAVHNTGFDNWQSYLVD